MTDQPEVPRDDAETVHEAELDQRMADILSGDRRSISHARRELREQGSGESDDLIGRLDALDYVDSLVGQPGSELPERLGEYRITDLLGRGGMGTVFEAFQESLERPVALKVLSPAMTSDQKMRRRFRIEARASATLHHQHIVPVYGFGETAGYLYFTMERVDGVSLDKHISRNITTGTSPDPRETARQFAGVADALAHAHRRGILHRDVKPGNILVHPDKSLALADFGLSKMLNEVSMSMSAAGGFLGTLHYAAPEQAKGKDASFASDLYSLGVTMFETLTNELPVEGRTTEAMLDAVLHAEPAKLRTKLPKAPKDLEAVIHKLLQKEPEDRYSDGEALARDLLRVADDEPVRIRRLPAFVRAWRTIRKHPALSTAIGIALILVIIVLWLSVEAANASQEQMLTRHRGLLDEAAKKVAERAGDARGAPGLLASLTGLTIGEIDDGNDVKAVLLEASSLRPEDFEWNRIWIAFKEDPESKATKQLRAGRGRAARDTLQVRIDELEDNAGFATGDAITLMKLYRLYLSRAIAYLTPAVADPVMAGKDLLRASLIRRGAFFPQVLTTILEWRVMDGPDALFTKLDRLLADAPDGGRKAVGALLIAYAHIDPPAGANMMSFPLEFGLRRRIHERGVEMWGGDEEFRLARDGAPGLGLEGRLRQHGREVRRVLGVADEIDRWLNDGRGIVEREVARTSPLRSWRLTYELFASPAEVEFTDAPDARDYQIRGLIEYLRLGPQPGALSELAPRIRLWLSTMTAQSIEAAQLRALFAAVTTSSDAFDLAGQWVRSDPEDPEAYLCRMRCQLARDVDEAVFDATMALQKAVDKPAVRSRVIEILREAEARNDEFTEYRRMFDSGN